MAKIVILEEKDREPPRREKTWRVTAVHGATGRQASCNITCRYEEQAIRIGSQYLLNNELIRPDPMEYSWSKERVDIWEVEGWNQMGKYVLESTPPLTGSRAIKYAQVQVDMSIKHKLQYGNAGKALFTPFERGSAVCGLIVTWRAQSLGPDPIFFPY